MAARSTPPTAPVSAETVGVLGLGGRMSALGGVWAQAAAARSAASRRRCEGRGMTEALAVPGSVRQGESASRGPAAMNCVAASQERTAVDSGAMRVGWAIVLCALGCAAGGHPPPAPPPRVTVESSGRAVLAVFQELAVQLEANATTGYAWELVAPVPDVVTVVDPGRYQARPDTEGRVGSGGVTTFVFRAVHAGTGTLELVYRRPWERGVAPARTVRVDLEVR